jgi:hypothetical protein
MRIAPKLIAAGNPENGIPKTLINGALKIQNTVSVHLVSAMGT